MQTTTTSRHILLALAATLCATAPVLRAQSNTATITGTVQDETGASIPDATVTVRNLGTGQARTVKSDGSGAYTVPNLQVGHYSVSISRDGFTPTQIGDTELQVAQRATINPTLHVGAITDKVEVIASQIPLLNDASSAVGQVIDTQTVQNVPLNGRNFWQLTQLTPGVSFIQGGQNIAAGGTSIRASAVNVNVNGLSPSWTGWYLDGSNITESQLGGTLISPNVDALQEFKVESSNMPADYGHSPTIVNATLKSGTNAFHGTAYEFLRNNAFDAKNYFYVPPVGSTRRNQPLHRNQFGFVIGGPIVKDHTFFFLDLQSTLYTLGQNFDNIVPSAAQRTGDYSELLAGSKPTRIKDPLTGVNFANNVIPASRIAPQAAFFLKYLPQANQVRNGVSHAVLTNRLKQQLDQGDIRVDQTLFSKDRLMGRYSITNNRETDPNRFPLLGGFPLRSRGQNIVLRETHIFSPKWLAEAQFSYYRSVFFFNSSVSGQNLNAAAGIKGLEGLAPDQYQGAPQLNITNYAPFDGQAANYPKQNKIRSWQYLARGTYTSGKHEVRLGYENFHDTNTYLNGANSVGTFGFGNNYSGDNFADFLLGYPSNATRGYFRAIWGSTVNFHALYVQDDWKVTPKLTLNMGLRYEINPFYDGIQGQTSGYDTSNNKIVIPANFSQTAQPGTATLYSLFSDRIEFNTAVGLGTSIRPAAKKNFAPRLGFAYSPGGNTVLRGAYGIFFNTPDNNAINNTQNTVPFVASQTVNNNNTPNGAGVIIPTFTLADAYQGQPIVAPNSANATCSFGFVAKSCSAPNVTSMDLRVPNTYVQEYNVAVQHQFGRKLSIDVAYVGNRALHITQPFQINDPFPGAGAIQARRPAPQWGTVSIAKNVGNLNYNALQTKVETRALSGATLLVSYTYGACLTDGTFNGLTREQNGGYRYYGPCNYDIKHNFVTSGVYELPFGRGKMFAGNASGFVNGIVGGWSVSGVGTLQSALPYTLTVSGDPANTGLASQRPNYVQPTVVRSANCWFYSSKNTGCPTSGVDAAQAVPTARTYGNGSTNSMRADGLVQFDVSLLKRIAFGESRSLELRGSFFNVANHTTFAAPATNVDAASAGQITSTLNSARTVELAAKLYF